MKATRTVPDDCRYVLTEAGVQALLTAEPCRCEPRLVGYLVECRLCGTVYGHIKESLDWGRGRAEYKR